MSAADGAIDETEANERARAVLAHAEPHHRELAVQRPDNPVLRALYEFRRAIDGIAGVTGWITRALVFLVLLMVLWSVFSRRIDRTFGTGLIISWMIEAQRNGFAFLTLFGLNYGMREGVNPRVDFWWAEFSARRKALIDFVLHLLLFAPFAWLAVSVLWGPTKRSVSGSVMGEFSTWRIWETWEQSPDAGGLPVSPVRMMLVLGFFLLLLQTLAEIVKNLFVLIGRPEYAGIEERDAPLRIE